MKPTTSTRNSTIPHQPQFGYWLRGGEPLVWLNGAAVSLCIIAVVGLLALLAVRGFSHFWPADIMSAQFHHAGQSRALLGEVVEQVEVSTEQLRGAGYKLQNSGPFHQRSLLKQGNRDYLDQDFVWVLNENLSEQSYPPNAMVIERLEWGDFYGFLRSVSKGGETLASATDENTTLWQTMQQALASTLELRRQIHGIEYQKISAINYKLKQLDLDQRRLQREGSQDSSAAAQIQSQQIALNKQLGQLQSMLKQLYRQVQLYNIDAELADGRLVTLPLSKIVRAYRPNALSWIDKTRLYIAKLWEFLSEPPREANSEGGVFPAIFGTVMMVILMSIIVTPFGVMAAVYLREYAHQGWLTQTIRVAVNNLAGVPSIVYGVFGLGFFIYFLGGQLDQLFFAEALPRPTFGTPGLMWASLTLALLTLPVVIVATEEGLARIPQSLREGSLALGATRAETLWHVVLPAASPAMMTGIILAVARAAGEVAPLMLVGVVKLAPTLPVDGNFPYIHLEQQFMHLGFHIYEVGFQSPNIEAARPLVYATALLLVIIIALLNFTAVTLRNRLRDRYQTLEN